MNLKVSTDGVKVSLLTSGPLRCTHDKKRQPHLDKLFTEKPRLMSLDILSLHLMNTVLFKKYM